MRATINGKDVSPFSIDSLAGTGLEIGWSVSVADRPSDLPFLEPQYIRESAGWTELSDDAVADCLEAAVLIGSDAGLHTLAWHVHRVLFHVDTIGPDTSRWPADIPGLGSFTGAFYLILALSGIRRMRTDHIDHGISESISRLNCRDIHIWAKEYHALGEPTDTGFRHTFTAPRWGLHTRGFRWVLGSLTGRILRLGRLQFIHASYRSEFHAYRHVTSGLVQVAAGKGHRFSDDGWKTGDKDTDGWSSSFVEDEDRTVATPIAPSGRALREPITLDAKEWNGILAPGDPIVEIHIPEDGTMDFDACGAALRELVRDYRTYFPDRDFKAIVCGSWLLDPQYQDGMPETSNICRFQKEAYLYPIGPGGGRSGFSRLFTHDDIATLPRDTVMRRTYLDLIESGGLWRGGGMMLFPEDLDWGNQVYLKQHKRED